MTAKYEWIRNYYVKGLYTTDNLATFVLAAWITQTESDEIIAYKTEIERGKFDVQTDTPSGTN